MNPIPRHTHSIEIEFSAKGFLLLRATIPLKLTPVFSISNYYKRTRSSLASSYKIPIEAVKGKHKKIESKLYNRLLFEFAGGISLNIPDDCSAYDYEIINHYIEGVRMAHS